MEEEVVESAEARVDAADVIARCSGGAGNLLLGAERQEAVRAAPGVTQVDDRLAFVP